MNSPAIKYPKLKQGIDTIFSETSQECLEIPAIGRNVEYIRLFDYSVSIALNKTYKVAFVEQCVARRIVIRSDAMHKEACLPCRHGCVPQLLPMTSWLLYFCL